MSSRLSFDQWKSDVLTQVDQGFEQWLPSADRIPTTLHRAMHYAVKSPGKRIRSLIACASGDLFGANIEDTVHCAVAIELIGDRFICWVAHAASDSARRAVSRASVVVSFVVVGHAMDGPAGLRGLAHQRCGLIDNAQRGTSVHYDHDCD